MSVMKDKITKAYQWATANKPKVNGYPYLAEALRQSGVQRYVYSLPSCQCIYFSKEGNVASQMDVLEKGQQDVPKFNQDLFIKVLRITQQGDITFPEFLKDSWEADVIGYEADLVKRKVTYFGADGELYVEDYPLVEVKL